MSSESLSDKDIKDHLNEKGVTISPSARDLLQSIDNIEPAMDVLVEEYRSRVMVSESDVRDIINRVEVIDPEHADSESDSTDTTADGDGNERESDSEGDEGDVAPDDSDVDEDAENEEEETDEQTGFRPQIRNHSVAQVTTHTADTTHEFDEDNPNLDDPFGAIERFDESDWPARDTDQRDITIGKGITGESKSEGDIEDFAKYFRSRYEKVSDILRDRVTPRSIDSLGTDSRRSHSGGEDDTLAVIGMVNDKFTTRNGNRMLVLEDTTGATIRVVFTDEDEMDRCDLVVNDEIVAVVGQLSDDGEIIFGDDIHFPDVPPRRTPNTADRNVKVALVSDIHFGAREFAVDKWNEFVRWIGDQPDIEYLLVAGDIIEGVGIYAGQQDELAVPNLERQYELCALAFDQLPDDLDIVVIPGNHDGVRLAEPQPLFDEDVRGLFGDNVHWGGNPSMVTIEDVKFLMYHGVSLNPIIDNLPDGDIQHPYTAMWPMLQKRHLAPMYGEGVRIAPEHEDHLVIEDVPDVFQTGHVHTFDIGDYNDVTLVNTGTWQHQTKYQIDLDVDPDVGYCSVVNLSDLSVELYHF